MRTPTEQAAQQDPSAERKRKAKEYSAKRYQARKAAAARVVELEALKKQGPLTEEQETELAELQPKAQQWQKKKDTAAAQSRAKKVAGARVAELEALAEQGPLTVEQEAELAELAELQTKAAQQRQKHNESAAKYHRAGMAAAARVAELEALAGQGPLTVEQEAELAELQPKAQQWQKKKDTAAARSRAGMAAVARVAELEALAEQGSLTVEQEAELAELRPKAQQKQKKKEGDAKRYQARMAAADRVAELEALAERGPLTEEQETELAELRPEQQQKQKKKESDAKYRRAGKAAVARVAELEALAERRPLTVEQEAELAELRPKAQQKQKKKEGDAKRYQARMAAADRVAELEALAERRPLTEEQEAELAELQPKVAQRKQQNTGRDVKYRRARRAEAARVVELEELAGRGPLTEEQAAELAALQPKVAQWKQQESAKSAKYRRARRAEADRVAELEALKEQGPLTEEQEAELVELQPKVAQRKQQNTGRDVKYRRARRAEAARVVELEELRGRGPLTGEQEAELAELQTKVAQLGTRGSGLSIQAGAGPEDQAGRSGESAAGWSSGQSGGPSQRHAAVPVDDAAGGAGHQAEREERAELIEEGRVRLEELGAQKAELEELQERAWDPVRQAKLEALPGRIATVQAEVDALANREAALRVWDERYERAKAQLDEWAGIAGRGAVDRLLADADGILGPLAVSERFRMVLVQWLGEHPGDWRGAQAVRRELAGYLAGDPDFGVAVSGLPRGAFEEARAEETRWQADRAGD
ncbi:hypothetical protein [Saccharopolyspora spinosa]|uniref:hypothetical protein n=1 Tax=Saccharopolyspora spinosa TaxID=60894 RepID=UPI00376EAFE4